MNDQPDGESAQPADEPATEPTPQPTGTAVYDPDDNQVMIGVRTREASRIYHFAAPRGRLFAGDYVVIDRARGEQLARVVSVPDDDAPAKPVPHDVRPIVRLADSDDRDRAAQQAERADDILQAMRSAAVQDDSGFYPVAVELNLTGDRGTAWFQSPEHVDFRALLDDVQQRYDVELKMQQANDRERASLVDGYDMCGLRLCCASWMTDFPRVGVKVAKDQGLSLNPDSISGVCGRLLCCLTFEHEVYREMRGTLPKVGKRVSTPAGMGKVVKLNILQQKVTIALDDHHDRVDVPADEIGLAVRTEDAPNQALVDAERSRRQDDERAEALRRAAAPQSPVQSPTQDDADETEERRPRRRRRRGRRTSGEAPQQQPQSDAPQRSRRRRRKPKAVNQGDDNRPEVQPDDAAAVSPPEGERRPRRRRRRSRQQVNNPEPPSEE